MSKLQYIPRLLQLFRACGYDGATLSKMSEATGLGKASLYHHFPGGKDEIVATILDYLDQVAEERILGALNSDGDPFSRFQRMCDGITEMYEGGEQPCLFAVLLMGSSRSVFHEKVEQLFRVWIGAIADVLVKEGLDQPTAMSRSEDAVLAIQGSLILSQGLNDSMPFQRIIRQLPPQLCRDLEVSHG